MGKKIVKGTMHSGKGNRKHNDHDWMEEGKKDVVVTTYACTVDLPETSSIQEDIEQTLEIMSREQEMNGTCADDEVAFYKTLYGETYRQQMERYRKKGNYNRLKTFEVWVSCPNYSPVEDIIQIGNKDCQIPDGILDKCIEELMAWEHATLGRNVATISVAWHRDETTDHYHKRDTYIYWDPKDGLPKPCIKDALEQAGIPLPYPNQKESRTNNRKMAYDKMRREKWYDIIEKHLPKDYELDRTPDKDRKFGHMSVKVFKEYEKVKAMEADLEQQQMDLHGQMMAVDEQRRENEARALELDSLERKNKADRAALEQDRQNYRSEVEKQIKKENKALRDQFKKQVDEKVQEINAWIKTIEDGKIGMEYLIDLGMQKEAEMKRSDKCRVLDPSYAEMYQQYQQLKIDIGYRQLEI